MPCEGNGCVGGQLPWNVSTLRDIRGAIRISTQETHECVVQRFRLDHDPSNFGTRISRNSRFFILWEKKSEFLPKKFKNYSWSNPVPREGNGCVGDKLPWDVSSLRDIRGAVRISTQEPQECVVQRLRLDHDPLNFDTRISRKSRFLICGRSRRIFRSRNSRIHRTQTKGRIGALVAETPTPNGTAPPCDTQRTPSVFPHKKLKNISCDDCGWATTHRISAQEFQETHVVLFCGRRK